MRVQNAFLFLMLSLSGCEGASPPPLVLSDAGRADSALDAGDSADAMIADSDGGADAGARGDGGRSGCSTTTTLVRARIESPRVALAAGTSSFAAAWAGSSGGFSEIEWAIYSAGLETPARGMTNLDVIAASPSLVAAGDDYTLAFHAAPEGDYEIYAASLGDEPRLASDFHRWTHRAGRDEHVVLTTSTGGVRAVWIAREGLRIDASYGVLGTGGGLESIGVIERDIATDSVSASGTWVAWVQATEQGSQALVRESDSQTDATRLSAESNLDGTLEILADADGGIGVYGISSGGGAIQVRARRFDNAGEPEGSEVIVSPLVSAARNPSIAAYGNEYVIAYRADSMLELAFVDSALRVNSHLDVTEASESGALSVRVTVEGTIGILHVDSQSALWLTRIQCG